jgi:hypothetical protein
MTLRDHRKRNDILMFTFCGEAIEHFIQQVQYMDERQGALFDVFMNTEINPVFVCRQSLSSIVTAGGSALSVLAPLFISCRARAEVDGVPLEQFVDESRCVALNMDAQCWWRFLHFQRFPYKWALGRHPGVGQELVRHLLEQFFVKLQNPCCRSPYFCNKVYNEFWSGDVNESIEKLLADTAFWDMINTWARVGFKYSNMTCERLLASIRAGLGDDLPDAERMCSSSVLTQMMTEHRRLGRSNPKCVTRSKLIDGGVPIRATKRARVSKPAGSFLAYKQQMDSQRLASGIHLGVFEYRTWLASLGETFSSMPDEERQAFQDEVQRTHSRKQAEADEDPVDSIPVDVGVLKTFVETEGDDSLPLKVDAFKRAVFEHLGKQGEGPEPGFTRYAEAMREKHVGRLFVTDDGAIPATDTFDYRLPCSLAHAGVCVTRDAEHMEVIYAIANATRRHLRSFKDGSPHRFFYVDDVGVTHTTYAVVAHQRGSKPPLAILADASFDDTDAEKKFLKLATTSFGLLTYKNHISFVGVSVKEFAPIASVHTQAMVYDQMALIGPDATGASLRINVVESDRAERFELYPNPIQERSRKRLPCPEGPSELERGLRNCRETSDMPSRVRIKDPSRHFGRIKSTLGIKRARPDYSSGSSSGSDSVHSHESEAIAPATPEGPAPATPQSPPPLPAPMTPVLEGAPGAAPELAEDGVRPAVVEPVRVGVDTWHLPGNSGMLKFSRNNRLLAAHCPFGGTELIDGVRHAKPHGPGPCRLNRHCDKAPIGMLGRWLQEGIFHADRDSHFSLRLATDDGGALNYAARCNGRQWIQDLDVPDVNLLFELEPNGGRDGEPLVIR